MEETYSPDVLYWLILITILIASYAVQYIFNARIKKYSQVSMNLSGKDVAERMLRENGLNDVQVTCIPGNLTDHYNPVDRTVNLSEAVYEGRNLAAFAVASHECGHAVQHAAAYAPLTLRTALVPVVNFSNHWTMWVILAGMLLIESFPQILVTGIILYALTTLFTFITLPVEFDASRRAINWLEDSMLVTSEQTRDASSALRAAAYTYVVAALSSLATLLYYVLILHDSR